MTQSQLATAPALPSRASLDALVDALASERRLLDELVAIMRRQRSAVGVDDLEGVDDSVFATHRVLLTLNEARRRRRSLYTLLGDPEELRFPELEEAFGAEAASRLREAREGLRGAALHLSREVEVNRRVLREALATGDEYVRALCGAPDERRGGLLLDRRG